MSFKLLFFVLVIPQCCYSYLLCNIEIKNLNEIDCTIVGAEDNILNLMSVQSPTRKIRSLRAKGCRVRSALPSAFDAYTELEHVDLSNNYLVEFKDNIFNSTPNLQVLNLSNNLLTKLNKRLFGNLQQLRELDLTGNELILEGFSEYAPATLRILKLSNCEIIDLNSILPGIKLKILEISNSTLQKSERDLRLPASISTLKLIDMKNFTLVYDMLYAAPNLIQLDLSGNNITSIPPEFFTQSTKLALLNMSRNGIVVLAPETFSNNLDLFSVDLSFNRIMDLPVGIFDDNKELQLLNLNVNRIFKVDGSLIRNLDKLNSLDLSDNQLSALDPNFFANNTNLIELRMDGNYFHKFEKNELFSQSLNLRTLTLARNTIDIFSFTAIKNLKSLKVLDLDNNRIMKLDVGFHTGIENLKTLSIACNFLTALPRDFLIRAPKQDLVVHFYGNPLRCSCLPATLADSKTWLHSKKHFSDGHSVTCVMSETGCSDLPLETSVYNEWVEAMKISDTPCLFK